MCQSNINLSNSYRTFLHQPYEPPSEPTQTHPENDESAVSISYCANKHGEHEDFCRSADFKIFQKQFEKNLDFLTTFCKKQQVVAIKRIATNFETFRRHRFKDPHYFSSRAQLIDSVGKQSLDRFCAMIRDERIAVEIKKAAIQNLSEGLVLCADGATSTLISAEQELSKTIGGIRGKLWQIKEKIIKNTLHEAVCNIFGHVRNYVGNEIHYVNAAWNYVAHGFGLKEIEDLSAPKNLEVEFLNSCQDQLSVKLTPDRIAAFIAEESLQRLTSKIDSKTFFEVKKISTSKWKKLLRVPTSRLIDFLFKKKPSSTIKNADLSTSQALEKFLDALQVICDELGVSDTALSLHHFITLDDETNSVSLRTDATLIATQILRQMNALGLLQTEPINVGQWQENGEPPSYAALFCYGELAWVARGTKTALSEPGWSEQLEVEYITETDLHQWQKIPRDPQVIPPAAVVRLLIDKSEKAQLSRLPPEWLINTVMATRLLIRLEEGGAGKYFATHRTYFLDQFSASERLLLMGRYEAGLDILAKEYPSLLFFLAEMIKTLGSLYLSADRDNGLAGVEGIYTNNFINFFKKIPHEEINSKIINICLSAIHADFLPKQDLAQLANYCFDLMEALDIEVVDIELLRKFSAVVKCLPKEDRSHLRFSDRIQAFLDKKLPGEKINAEIIDCYFSATRDNGLRGTEGVFVKDFIVFVKKLPLEKINRKIINLCLSAIQADFLPKQDLAQLANYCFDLMEALSIEVVDIELLRRFSSVVQYLPTEDDSEVRFVDRIQGFLRQKLPGEKINDEIIDLYFSIGRDNRIYGRKGVFVKESINFINKLPPEKINSKIINICFSAIQAGFLEKQDLAQLANYCFDLMEALSIEVVDIELLRKFSSVVEYLPKEDNSHLRFADRFLEFLHKKLPGEKINAEIIDLYFSTIRDNNLYGKAGVFVKNCIAFLKKLPPEKVNSKIINICLSAIQTDFLPKQDLAQLANYCFDLMEALSSEAVDTELLRKFFSVVKYLPKEDKSDASFSNRCMNFDIEKSLKL
jgi:hypothetical protein